MFVDARWWPPEHEEELVRFFVDASFLSTKYGMCSKFLLCAWVRVPIRVAVVQALLYANCSL